MSGVPRSGRLRRGASVWLEEPGRSMAERAQLFSRLCRLAWRAAPGVASLLVLVYLALAMVPAAQVWAYKLLVDGIARAGSPSFHPGELWLGAALYALALLFSQAAAMLRGPLDDQLNERLQGFLRLTLLEVGQRQTGLAFYEDEANQNDLETARRSLDYVILEAMSLLPQVLQQLAVVLTLSALLGRLHPLLPLLLIASSLPRFRHEAMMRHYTWTGLTSQSPHWRWLNYCARVLFSVEFAKEVRLFGLGDFFLNLYRETFERAHEELVKIRRREQRGATLYALMSACVTGGAYVAIVLAAARRQLTIGDVALYTGATFQLSTAVSRLAISQGALREHRLRLQTLYGLLDRPPMLGSLAEDTGGPPAGETRDRKSQITIRTSGSHPASSVPSRAPELELRDVWFCYPDARSPALRGVNLRIGSGEKIALVGENGAGKTTLLSLIARLYDPTGGEILVNGISLRALDVRRWREQLASVSQEFLRLEAQLRTNLALGNLRCLLDDDALWTACEQVGLGEEIRTLPGGMDQILGRRFAGGVELSGGEWQKLAIARALLRDRAGVLMLDEPTSALDAPTEYAIFRQFVQLAAHRTTLLVSHRFSTVHMADRILVLDAGVIREEGTHGELMSHGGKYAELFSLQAARYR